VNWAAKGLVNTGKGPGEHGQRAWWTGRQRAWWTRAKGRLSWWTLIRRF